MLILSLSIAFLGVLLFLAILSNHLGTQAAHIQTQLMHHIAKQEVQQHVTTVIANI